VNLICGFHAERGKACPDTTAVEAVRGSVPSSMTCEELSTVAVWHAGGPARSSGEAPAWRGGGGAKGPDHLWLVRCVNRAFPGGTQ
jgi:hypothetical protein